MWPKPRKVQIYTKKLVNCFLCDDWFVIDGDVLIYTRGEKVVAVEMVVDWSGYGSGGGLV